MSGDRCGNVVVQEDCDINFVLYKTSIVRFINLINLNIHFISLLA